MSADPDALPAGPKPIAPDVWLVDARMRAGPLALIPLPIRMAVVRLPDKTLWLHSPVPFDDTLAAALAALGPIRHLVAPNRAHNSFIGEWQRAFPDAVMHATEGVAEHAAKQGRPLRVDAVIGASDPRWGGAIHGVLARGSWFTEAVFLHAPSRTLILTDLVENFAPKGAVARLAAWAAGTLSPHGSTPRYLRLLFLGRRRALLRQAVRQMLAWEPQRVVFAHGDWFAADACAQLRRAFAWLRV